MLLPFPISLDRVAALLPSYSEQGDCSTIITTDGEKFTEPVRIKTLIRRLAYAQAADLTALRSHAAKVTNKSLFQPLPLTAHLLLLPVKVRQPRVPGDTCTGYVNYHAIGSVEPSQETACSTVIVLKGGAVVSVLWTAITVRRHIQFAKLAAVNSPVLAVRETSTGYEPELNQIAQKLVEVFHDILMLKQDRI